MKQYALALILCVTCLSALAFDDFEGRYTNGPVTIEWQAGGRLGNEFVSSLCPSKKFRPRVHADHSRKGKDYAIKSDFSFSKLDITGANKCLPEGSYKRIP
jgi:hypothetical protein